jgi:nitrite reductase/ring-hydroxylating ferredoxin subunit
LYSLSWVQRRRGAEHRARWAGEAGWAVMAASSYLGGSLVYRHRIGVDHSDKELEPRQFTAVLAEGELGAEPRRALAHGVAVVLARAGGSIYALGDHCPHLGGPLSNGQISRGQIICPWHGSRFDLATGACRRGPATTGPPRFATRVRAGQIEIRRIPRCPPRRPAQRPGPAAGRR